LPGDLAKSYRRFFETVSKSAPSVDFGAHDITERITNRHNLLMGRSGSTPSVDLLGVIQLETTCV
jgi:hypothetical protein